MQRPEDRPRVPVTLKDGSEALLSPIVAADRDLLVEGFEAMSIPSRLARFGEARGRLSDAELTYLAEVDQRNHVAWGATIEGKAAGVGRYIIAGGCAEMAVTVVDWAQGKGLGRALYDALVAVARLDGVVKFCFKVHPENEPVLRVLQGIRLTLNQEEEMIEGSIPLTDVPVGSSESRFAEAMRLFR